MKLYKSCGCFLCPTDKHGLSANSFYCRFAVLRWERQIKLKDPGAKRTFRTPRKGLCQNHTQNVPETSGDWTTLESLGVMACEAITSHGPSKGCVVLNTVTFFLLITRSDLEVMHKMNVPQFSFSSFASKKCYNKWLSSHHCLLQPSGVRMESRWGKVWAVLHTESREPKVSAFCECQSLPLNWIDRCVFTLFFVFVKFPLAVLWIRTWQTLLYDCHKCREIRLSGAMLLVLLCFAYINVANNSRKLKLPFLSSLVQFCGSSLLYFCRTFVVTPSLLLWSGLHIQNWTK